MVSGALDAGVFGSRKAFRRFATAESERDFLRPDRTTRSLRPRERPGKISIYFSGAGPFRNDWNQRRRDYIRTEPLAICSRGGHSICAAAYAELRAAMRLQPRRSWLARQLQGARGRSASTVRRHGKAEGAAGAADAPRGLK